jgi:zinc protease
MDRSLAILEDWAHNVSFDAAEIDKERGVIWRNGGSAWAPTSGSGYQFRSCSTARATPIGFDRQARHHQASIASVETVLCRLVRPDLIAVVVVGDFDKAAIEARIRSLFGAIPATRRRNAAKRVYRSTRDAMVSPIRKRRSGIYGRWRRDQTASAPTGSRWSNGCWHAIRAPR